MYTPRDIEVFLFAHNRPVFLREALDCYLRQTVTGFRLAVLANGPTPEVLNVLQQYAAKGVETLFEPKSLNVYGCVQRSQELASRKIVVLAHDDDWVHPAYLESLLSCYNQFPSANVVLSASEAWNGKPFLSKRSFKVTRLSQPEFAAYIFLGYSFTFSSSSYKTQLFKKAPSPDFARFGKVNDCPFMVGVCQEGQAIVLQFPFIKYRVHPAQDSRDFSSGPTAAQWIALDLYHKNQMMRGGWRLQMAYVLNAFHRLKVGWHDWCVCEHDRMTFAQYLQLACCKGAFGLPQRVAGWVMRGELRKELLSLLCSFHFQKLK